MTRDIVAVAAVLTIFVSLAPIVAEWRDRHRYDRPRRRGGAR